MNNVRNSNIAVGIIVKLSISYDAEFVLLLMNSNSVLFSMYIYSTPLAGFHRWPAEGAPGVHAGCDDAGAGGTVSYIFIANRGRKIYSGQTLIVGSNGLNQFY